MSVAGLSRRASPEPEFTCPHYRPVPGSKRCESYQDGGTCARPDTFVCLEWERRNRHRLPVIVPAGEASLGLAGRGEAGRGTVRQATEAGSAADAGRRTPAWPTDLFGNPVPELAPKETPRPPPASSPAMLPSSPADERPLPRPLRGLTTEDIESFKALGVEVCLRSEELGEIWIVGEYSGRDRREISIDHAAVICRVVEAFPGSRVTSFEKLPPGGAK